MKLYILLSIFGTLISNSFAKLSLRQVIDANVGEGRPFEETNLYESFIEGEMGSGKY